MGIDLFENMSFTQDIGPRNFFEHAARTPAEKVDVFIVDELRNFLFMTPGRVIGEDLMARNLARARFIGAGSYEMIAKCYGVDPIQIFEFDDPLLGMLSEELEEGSSLGPTIARVVFEQFTRLRLNDPTFFEKPGVLSSHEFSYVKSITLSDLIRKHTRADIPAGDAFFVSMK